MPRQQVVFKLRRQLIHRIWTEKLISLNKITLPHVVIEKACFLKHIQNGFGNVSRFKPNLAYHGFPLEKVQALQYLR